MGNLFETTDTFVWGPVHESNPAAPYSGPSGLFSPSSANGTDAIGNEQSC